MSLLVFVLSLLFLCHAEALKLQYIGETSIAAGTKLQNTTIGGLSGIAYHDGRLYALSDDKGGEGEPRFYEFTFKIEKNKPSLVAQKAVFLTGAPALSGQPKPRLDPEGFARLPNGDFIVSSEGNNDAKPREMSRIFRINAGGAFQQEYSVPDKFLPEKTGQQSKGVQNNASFEGLSLASDSQSFIAAIEASLTQDLKSEEEGQGDWIRMIQYKAVDKTYQPGVEFAYRIDPFRDQQKGKEIFRGVSEILTLNDSKVLVLERGVRLFSLKSWAQTAGIYLADLSEATNVSNMQKLSEKSFKGVTKTKLIDFEIDLGKYRDSKKVQNFECLAWGPVLADGRKTLLVMSDNNFSKKDPTELIVFAVEGE